MAAPDAPAKFSLALGSKKAARPPPKKRPHSALHDSDDEDAGPQAQEVSHFDQSVGGAIDASKPTQAKGPLVIPKQANRDWRGESQSKRQKNPLPPEAQAAKAAAQNGGIGNGDTKDADIPEEQRTFGLNVIKKADGQEGAATEDGTAPVADEPASAPAEPKTEDQLALEALLGQKQKSDLAIPTVESEEEAFRRDYDNAPEMATLEEYEAVPVEEFGAALLRGMGWKEGEAIGRRKGQKAVKPRILEKRPALLGIGAKEDAAVGEELGSWGKGAKSKRKTEQSYNPVMLRNKATGEQLTEEELKAKMEEQKVAEREFELAKREKSPARDSDRHRSDKSSRRSKYDDDYESERRDRDRRRDRDHDRDRRRDRERDRDYDSKHRSSRRERSSSRDRDSKYRSSRRDRSETDEDRYRRRRRAKDYDTYDRRDRDRKRPR